MCICLKLWFEKLNKIEKFKSPDVWTLKRKDLNKMERGEIKILRKVWDTTGE